MCSSAEMRPNLQGLMEARAYPLVSLRPGCFFPAEQSHTSAQHTDIAWTPCHKHFWLSLGPMCASLGEVTLSPSSRILEYLVVIQIYVCRVKGMHHKRVFYRHVHYVKMKTHLSFRLSLYMVRVGKVVDAITVSQAVRQQL